MIDPIKPKTDPIHSPRNKLAARMVLWTLALIGMSVWVQTGQALSWNPQANRQQVQQKRARTVLANPIQNRVGVMPLEHEAQHGDVAAKFQQKLASQLRGMNNQHSVKLKSTDFAACNQDWIEKGRYPMEILAKANSIYNVDRVLFVRVNNWQAFEPMEIGVTLHLVDSREAQLLVSENQNWSLQTPEINEAYRRYLCKRFRGEGDISIYYRCPTYFLDFVSEQVARISSVR